MIRNSPFSVSRLGRKGRNAHLGFTIVELIVVIAVIAILVAIVLVSYGSWRKQTAINEVKSDLGSISHAMESDLTFGTKFPTSIPSSYSKSPNIQTATLTTSSSKDFYCVTVTSAADPTVSLTITSTNKDPRVLDCATFANVSVGNGLVGWWKLNGNVTDSSPNSNNGSVVNGAVPGTGQGGVANTAYSFNGTTQYIDIPNSNSLRVGENFSVSAWIYPTDISVRNAVFSTRSSLSVAGNWQLDIGSWNSVTGRVGITGVGGTIVFQTTNAGVISANAWQHILFTKSTGDRGKVYVNGVQAASTSTAYDYFDNGNSDRIGFGNGSQWFPGRIDDVRLYNRSISASDASAIYSTGAL